MSFCHKELYRIIKPLTHKKPKIKFEGNEQEYKKYYIAASKLGVIKDNRYSFFNNIRTIIRAIDFEGKCMWERGNQQSLTYRTNRVEENLKEILNTHYWKGTCPCLWKVYQKNSYERIGYVKASLRSEAEQLAELLYSGMITRGVSVQETKIPVWSDEPNDEFVNFMLEDIQKFKRKISSLRARIDDDLACIKDFERNISLLHLNIGAFSEQ